MSILKIKNDKGKWENVKTIIGPRGKDGAPGPAGRGVPAGGQPGDVLMKNSEVEGDTIWGKVLTPVTEQNYVSGMEEESPILVVYKAPHIVDPNTELELTPGTVYNINNDMQIEVESYAYDEAAMQYNGILRARNTSENTAYECYDIQSSCNDVYGNVIGWTTLSLYNQRDGSNFFEPGDISHDIPVQDYREFAYYVPTPVSYLGRERLDYENSSNLLLVEAGSSKSYLGIRLTIESITDGLAKLVLENEEVDSKKVIHSLQLPICDEWGRNMGGIDFSNNFTLEYGRPIATEVYLENGSILHLAFDNVETYYKHVINPDTDLLIEENSEITLGDFKYTFNSIEYSSGMTKFNISVTNNTDFDIRLPKPFEFTVYNAYGEPLNTMLMQGYVGETIKAGETKTINSGIDTVMATAEYINFIPWVNLNSSTMIIPIVPSNKVEVEPGVTVYLEEFYAENDATQTRMRFENNSGAEITAEYTADIIDIGGNVIWSPSYLVVQIGDGSYSNPNSGIGGTDYYNDAYAITNIHRKESE